MNRIALILCFFTLLNLNAKAQTINVEWDNVQGTVPSQLVSLNIWDGTNPNVATDALYQSNIADLNLSIVRYHSAEMVMEGNAKCWINYTAQKWNGTTVKKTLSALHTKVGERMISIFNFPKWLCPNPSNVKYMPPSQAAAFGDWCAALVDSVNKNSPYYAKYWEVFNELEGEYAGKMDELITIYNAAAVKMKAKDPTIKIGGMSLTQPWWSPAEQEQFYKGVATNLDFVSCHSYGMGSSAVANTVIYKAAQDLSYNVGNNMRSRMNAAGISSNIPIYLGETNISYAWNLDPASKMASNVGAVFDAIVLKTAIDNKKLASVQMFNDRDGFYGKMSATNAKRPAYEVLKLASKNFTGSFVRSVSNSEDSIQALAVINANGNRGIMLINRALQDKSIVVNFTGTFAANGLIYTENNIKNALAKQNLTWTGTSRTFTMPAESVIFWEFTKAQSTAVAAISDNDENIIIYPTTTDNKLTIKGLTQKIKTVVILNSKGQALRKLENTGDEISVSTLAQGIYFLEIILENQARVVRKFVKM
jgi:Glycosyl hydrolases family 39/Secretion system C-terminal sorting domain